MLHRNIVRHKIAQSAPAVLSKTQDTIQYVQNIWNMYAHDTQAGLYLASYTARPCAVWSECLATTYEVTRISRAAYHVYALDGSQIYPDYHMGISAYLINIAHASIRFGDNAYAHIDAHPYVHCDNGGVSRSCVDAKRLSYEISHITRAPDMAYVILDGPMTWWPLAETVDFPNAISCLGRLHEHNMSCCGYMSAPQHTHLVNALRAGDCTCGDNDGAWEVNNLSDAQLLYYVLPQWHRTIVFSSTDNVNASYPDHLRPYFCYCNIGQEIVRIEIPAYIAASASAVDALLSMLRDQIEKGFGYPVALSEAHEAAVIREDDRQFFFEALASYTSRDHVSQKQRLKHVPVI